MSRAFIRDLYSHDALETRCPYTEKEHKDAVSSIAV